MREEILAPVIQILRREFERVFPAAILTRNSEIAHRPCDESLKSGWLGRRTKPPVNQECKSEARDDCDRKNRIKKHLPWLHVQSST
jgi:hypothetical protein